MIRRGRIGTPWQFAVVQRLVAWTEPRLQKRGGLALTGLRECCILQFAWLAGTDAIRSFETTRIHRTARWRDGRAARRGYLAAGPIRAPNWSADEHLRRRCGSTPISPDLSESASGSGLDAG